METLKVLSANSEHALGECRTDKKAVDWIVDNTDGKLSKIKTYEQLLKYVKRSTYLKLQPSHDATANLLRYVLNNGDVVEVTTDGRTAILNGNLLTAEEKDALMFAISNKDLQVAHKSDPSKPVQVMPKINVSDKQEELKSGGLSPDVIKAMEASDQKSQKARNTSNEYYDHDIETGDYRGAEDPEYVKQMLYKMKYGGS